MDNKGPPQQFSAMTLPRCYAILIYTRYLLIHIPTQNLLGFLLVLCRRQCDFCLTFLLDKFIMSISVVLTNGIISFAGLCGSSYTEILQKALPSQIAKSYNLTLSTQFVVLDRSAQGLQLNSDTPLMLGAGEEETRAGGRLPTDGKFSGENVQRNACPRRLFHPKEAKRHPIFKHSFLALRNSVNPQMQQTIH